MYIYRGLVLIERELGLALRVEHLVVEVTLEIQARGVSAGHFAVLAVVKCASPSHG